MKKLSHRLSHPSLFPLRMVLFTAELDTPAQPPHLLCDPDELLALTLIEKIRQPRPASFAGTQIEFLQPFQREIISAELVSAHA